MKYVPRARALADAKAGKADGLHGAWYAKEREEWFVYSDKLPGNEVVLYKRKGSEPHSFMGYPDLKPYKQLVEVFNQGLKQLKESGRSDEIIADA